MDGLTDPALLESEARFRSLFSEMIDGCALHEIVCDDEGRPVDYLTLDVNKAFEVYLGVSRDSVVGRLASTILPGEELRRWVGIFGAVALSGTSRNYEMYSPANAKHFEGVAFQTAPGKFAVAFRDVTARKRLEERLLESEQRYRDVVEGTDDLITKVNAEGVFQFVNSACERVFGHPRERLLGMSAFSFVHPDDRESTRSWFQDAITSGIAHAQIRNRQVNAVTGEARTMLWTSHFSFAPNGAMRGMTGLARDITDLEQAESALRSSLMEKEVLLKEIHHRVKNNMQVIYSLLDLQAKRVTDTTVRAILEESRNRINSMALIHENLYQSRDLAHVDFREYLRQVVAGIADTYRRHDIICDVDMEPVALDAHLAVPCGLIVNELASNSLKHAFPAARKGTLKIGMAGSRAGHYVLSVGDNGIGFPPELDFRNTSSLGLQLVNVLVTQIHGTLELSRAGGTLFTITFPGTSGGGDE